MENYSSIDRAAGYIALFLIGVIGWTCDRVAVFRSSIVANNHSEQGARR